MKLEGYMAIAAVVLIGTMIHFAKAQTRSGEKVTGKHFSVLVMGLLIGIGLMATGFLTDAHSKKVQVSQLREQGFVSIELINSGYATVSVPGYPIGCRIDLELKGNKWFADIAGVEYKTPIIDASEFTQRKEFVRWCGP